MCLGFIYNSLAFAWIYRDYTVWGKVLVMKQVCLWEIMGCLTGLHCKDCDNDVFRGGLSPLSRYQALCLLPGMYACRKWL